MIEASTSKPALFGVVIVHSFKRAAISAFSRSSSSIRAFIEG